MKNGLTLLLCLVASVLTRASDHKAYVAALQQKIASNSMVVRNFYTGDELDYDSAGEITSKNPLGAWPLCGYVKIRKVDLRKDSLEIHADRTFIHFSGRDMRTFDQEDGKSTVLIKLAIKPEESDEEISAALGNIFLKSSEQLTDIAPAYWQDFLRNTNLKDAKLEIEGRKVERVGHGIKPPYPVHDPDPPYGEVAERRGIQGSVLLQCVVDIDGHCKRVQIQRPVGYGLDELAVTAVNSWLFTPSKKGNEIVPVFISIEVNFRRY